MTLPCHGVGSRGKVRANSCLILSTARRLITQSGKWRHRSIPCGSHSDEKSGCWLIGDLHDVAFPIVAESNGSNAYALAFLSFFQNAVSLFHYFISIFYFHKFSFTPSKPTLGEHLLY